jgi:hypothetical protein
VPLGARGRTGKRAESGLNAPTLNFDSRSWTAIVSAAPGAAPLPLTTAAPAAAAARDDDSAAVAAPARAPREHPVFCEHASPEELRFVALLCERAATRVAADAAALLVHGASLRRIAEQATAQWMAAGASPTLCFCFSPECTFVGPPNAVLMHERTVHSATAVDLHARHVSVAIAHGRDSTVFRLACLPSLGKSCWLTASLALFEVIVSRLGAEARTKVASHPVVSAALDQPKQREHSQARSACRRTKPLPPSMRSRCSSSRWGRTSGSGPQWPAAAPARNAEQWLLKGRRLTHPSCPRHRPILAPGTGPLARLRSAAPSACQGSTRARQSEITDDTPAIPGDPDYPTGEVFAPADDESDDAAEADGPTRPCATRDERPWATRRQGPSC